MLFLFLLSLAPLVIAKNELYMGYKIYNVKVFSQQVQENLQILKSDKIDFLIKPNFKYGVTGVALVPPSEFDWFEEKLEELNINIDVAVEDVYQYLLEKESKLKVRGTSKNDTKNPSKSDGDGENDEDTDQNGGNTSELNNMTEEAEENNVTEETEENNTTEETGENNVTEETEENNMTEETEEYNVTEETDENDVTEESEENNETEENNVTEETEENNLTEETEENNVTEETEENNVTEESEEEEVIFDYDDFYRYNAILNHIYKLRDAYENSATTNIDVVQYGVTEQNRPLIYLKITSGGADTNKPIVVIESGLNPREWITIPSALKIVDEILEIQQTRYLENFDWIIVPVVNPDGYEYTHTDLRFWEKNLSTRSSLGFICPGVNINRNFNIDWSRSDSSSSACSHLYAGVGAVSEVETQFIQNIIDTYKDRISLYISLHAGGGLISYPWQYEFAASGTFRQNHLLGMEMVAAMQEEYNLDIASVAFGDRASGTSSDYARINDVPNTLNLDIAGRGVDGVIVPENEIVDIIEDVWRAVAVAADYLIQ